MVSLETSCRDEIENEENSGERSHDNSLQSPVPGLMNSSFGFHPGGNKFIDGVNLENGVIYHNTAHNNQSDKRHDIDTRSGNPQECQTKRHVYYNL